jgi:hypothetical protein
MDSIHEKISMESPAEAAPKGHRGWAASTLTDIIGTSQLNIWLAQDPKQRFLPDIKATDSFPEFDGSIILGERGSDGRITPVGKVEVQVKSVAATPKNNNKVRNCSDYKYSCDVAVFHAVHKQVSKNPTVLIIADTESGRCFRLLLTRGFVDSLELDEKTQRKTVYFNDEDALENYDKFFKELMLGSKTSVSEYARALNHGLVCPDDISEERFHELDKQVDRLNYLCDTKLAFLKKWSFKDAWRIGLLYREEENRYCLALVAMEYGGEEHIELRSLATEKDIPYLKGTPLAPSVNDDAHFAVVMKKDAPFAEAVDKLLVMWCRTFTDTWFIPPAAMSEDLLDELSFYYLDTLATWVPGLAAGDSPVHLNRDRMTADEFKRYVEAVYYAFDQYYFDIFKQAHIEHGEHDVLLCEMPNKGDLGPDWFQKLVIEYINGNMQYEKRLNLQFTCDKISIRLITTVADEACKRQVDLSRIWKLSPWSAVEGKIQRYSAAKSPSYLYTPFDFLLIQSDFEANFSKFVQSVGPTSEFAAKIFFGDAGAHEVPRHTYDCTLCDNEFFAQYRAIVLASEREEWHLTGILPYEENADYPEEVINQLEKEHGVFRVLYTSPPKFIDRLPLYSAIEEFLARGIKAMLGEDAVRLSTFPEERKRKESMSYVTSWSLMSRS